MTIKFEKLQVGGRYYDRHHETLGNTTMSRESEWPVEIISLRTEDWSAEVRWNGNRPERWYWHRLRRLSAKSRREIDAAKAKKAKMP